MVTWVRHNVDSVDEQVLAIGMITSDVFLAKMQDLFDPDFFINDSLKTICLWCMFYYEQYEQAPKQHIQDVFEEKRFALDKANAQLIEEFLILLNKRYVDFEEPVNDDYFINRAKKYFTKRNLKVRSQKMQLLLELDKVDEAEEEIEKYKKFSVISSPAVNPLSDEMLRQILRKKEEPFFNYPGALGEMIGPIERGYLVGILGVFKRGKCLREGTQVVMSDGRLKKIESVKAGELVLSLNEQNKLVDSCVINCVFNGVKETFQVITRTGRKVSGICCKQSL